MGMIAVWVAVPPQEADRAAALDGDAFVDWSEAHGGAELDLDKQWHALHAVLTGTAWDAEGPLGAAVLGGEEFGEDQGYGPARLLGADAVAATAAALDDLGPDGFAARQAATSLAELDVYPSGVAWDHPDERAYLLDSFRSLADFYRAAAAAGHAMILAVY